MRHFYLSRAGHPRARRDALHRPLRGGDARRGRISGPSARRGALQGLPGQAHRWTARRAASERARRRCCGCSGSPDELGVPLYSLGAGSGDRRPCRALVAAARSSRRWSRSSRRCSRARARRGRVPGRDARAGGAGRAGARVRAHHRAPPARPVPRVHGGRSHPVRACAGSTRCAPATWRTSSPELARLMRELADPLPLYLGMLLHDAGKGLGGDHSERGKEHGRHGGRAARAQRRASARSPSSWSSHHLTMSQTVAAARPLGPGADRRVRRALRRRRRSSPACTCSPRRTCARWRPACGTTGGRRLVQRAVRQGPGPPAGQGAGRGRRGLAEAFAARWRRALGARGGGGPGRRRSPTATSSPRRRRRRAPARTRSCAARAAPSLAAAVLRRTTRGPRRADPSAPPTRRASSRPVAGCSPRTGWTSSPRDRLHRRRLCAGRLRGAGRARRGRWSGSRWRRRPRRPGGRAREESATCDALLAGAAAGSCSTARCRRCATRVTRRQPRLAALHRGGRARRGPARACSTTSPRRSPRRAWRSRVAKVATEANRAIDSFYVTAGRSEARGSAAEERLVDAVREAVAVKTLSSRDAPRRSSWLRRHPRATQAGR